MEIVGHKMLPMSNVNIPEDLVWNILLRLPVKSLVRFKCVSKSWCLMIESPDFVKTHMKQSESITKLMTGSLYYETSKLYVVDYNLNESSKAKNSEEINYPSIMYDNYNGITFEGSCNGLICLAVNSKGDDSIVLWNPSTREHLVLPPMCVKQNRNYIRGLGFGYDEVTDDYKVVRLVTYSDAYIRPVFSDFLIYSLKSNEWRSLENFTYGDSLQWCFTGVFVNGAMHSLINDDKSILAFNLGTDRFQVLPIPEALTDSIFHLPPMLGGCQHLTFAGIAFWSDSFQLWVMKDYGIKDSWTKIKLNISTSLNWSPIVWLMNDKHLFLKRDHEKIDLCDLEEQSFQEVKLPAAFKRLQACVYSESLVRLDAGGKSDGTARISGKKKTQRKEFITDD